MDELVWLSLLIGVGVLVIMRLVSVASVDYLTVPLHPTSSIKCFPMHMPMLVNTHLPRFLLETERIPFQPSLQL